MGDFEGAEDIAGQNGATGIDEECVAGDEVLEGFEDLATAAHA